MRLYTATLSNLQLKRWQKYLKLANNSALVLALEGISTAMETSEPQIKDTCGHVRANKTIDDVWVEVRHSWDRDIALKCFMDGNKNSSDRNV